VWSVTFTTKPESFITSVSLVIPLLASPVTVLWTVMYMRHYRYIKGTYEEWQTRLMLVMYWIITGFYPRIFVWSCFFETVSRLLLLFIIYVSEFHHTVYHYCFDIHPCTWVVHACMYMCVCVCALMAARDFVVFTVHVRKRCTQRACSMKVNRHMHNL